MPPPFAASASPAPGGRAGPPSSRGAGDGSLPAAGARESPRALRLAPGSRRAAGLCPAASPSSFCSSGHAGLRRCLRLESGPGDSPAGARCCGDGRGGRRRPQLLFPTLGQLSLEDSADNLGWGKRARSLLQEDFGGFSEAAGGRRRLRSAARRAPALCSASPGPRCLTGTRGSAPAPGPGHPPRFAPHRGLWRSRGAVMGLREVGPPWHLG